LHPGYAFSVKMRCWRGAAPKKGSCSFRPSPEALDLFGDKAKALRWPELWRVPVIEAQLVRPRWRRQSVLAIARSRCRCDDQWRSAGRPRQRIADASQLEKPHAHCQSEAKPPSEAMLFMSNAHSQARHIEVQIIGDALAESAILGARMHDPAAQPKTHRDSAEPVARRWLAIAHHRGPRQLAVARATTTSALRIPVDDGARLRDRGLAFIEPISAPSGSSIP